MVNVFEQIKCYKILIQLTEVEIRPEILLWIWTNQNSSNFLRISAFYENYIEFEPIPQLSY